MPESTRFREKTAERRARKFNESNLTQPSGDRKLCEISRDFYVRSGHKKRTTSRSRSTNRRRKEERGKSKRKSQTRGGASRQVALETSARSRSRVEETRKKRTSRRKSPMQRKTIEAEINTGRGQRRTPKNQKRMKDASTRTGTRLETVEKFQFREASWELQMLHLHVSAVEPPVSSQQRTGQTVPGKHDQPNRLQSSPRKVLPRRDEPGREEPECAQG